MKKKLFAELLESVRQGGEILRRNEGDEEIARICEVRHRISEEFGHDPYRLVAYYMELQKEHPEKLVPAPAPEAAGDPAPAQLQT